VRVAARLAEAKRSLAEVVADAEQVVDLADAALAALLVRRPAALAAGDQPPAPAVRRAVGEGGEELLALVGLLRPAPEGEPRVERVGLVERQVALRVAEGRRLAAAAAVRPEGAGAHVLAGDRDDDLDFVGHRSAVQSSGADTLRQLLVGADPA